MVILCPACSTGFNLPEKHITAKGAKLRCSKCSHIFRVRRVDGADEPEIFYKDEDTKKNEENGTSLREESDGFGSLLSNSDEAPSKQTMFGVAGFGKEDSDVDDGTGGTQLGIPAKSTPKKRGGLRGFDDVFDDDDDEDGTLGTAIGVGSAKKGDFAGGLDFGDLTDDEPAPKSSTAFGMARPATLPRKKLSGAQKAVPKKGLDLSKLRRPGVAEAEQPAEPKGTELGAAGAAALKPRRRRGDFLDSSLFGTSESEDGPSPMVMVPESEPQEELPPMEQPLDHGDPEISFGSMGLSDAIDDVMSAREEKQAARRPAPAPEPEPEPAAPDGDISGFGLDLFGDDEEEGLSIDAGGADPFGGAFGEEDAGGGLDFASLAQLAEEQSEPGAAEPEPEDEPMLMGGTPGFVTSNHADEHYGGHGGHGGHDAHDAHGAHGVTVDLGGGEELDVERNDDFWGQKDSYFGSADELVDTDYSAEGPAFDPGGGVVEPEPAPAPVQRAPQPAQRPRPAPQPEPARPAPAPVAPAPAPGPARRGPSGIDKAKNALIIGGGVILGMLALLVVLNDGVIDFKRFDVTLESAFTGKDFTPRPEWVAGSAGAPDGGDEAAGAEKTDGAKVTKPPALEIRSVSTNWFDFFAKKKKKAKTRAKTGEAIAVRGRVYNRTDDAFSDIRLRVSLMNEKEQIVAEKEIPVGGFVPDAKFAASTSVAEALALVPEAPEQIAARSVGHFTVVFDEIPKGIERGQAIGYQVEIIRQTEAKDL